VTILHLLERGTRVLADRPGQRTVIIHRPSAQTGIAS
jgi:hypothetical protein